MVIKKKPIKKVVKKPVPKRVVTTKVVKRRCPAVPQKKCPTVCKQKKCQQSGRRGKSVGKFGESIVAAINSVKDKIDDIKAEQAVKKAAYNAPYHPQLNPHGKTLKTYTREQKEAQDLADRQAKEAKYQQDLADYNAYNAQDQKYKNWAFREDQRYAKNKKYKRKVISQPATPPVPVKGQIWNAAKTVVGGTAKVISSGMDAAIQLEKDVRKAEEDKQIKRRREWEALTPENRAALINEQYEKRKMAAEISNMRSRFRDAQLDRTESLLTGQRRTPKVFKIASSDPFGGEDKFVDEYGNEVQDPSTEVRPKRNSQPRLNERRKEMDDVSNLLGGSFKTSKNYKEDVSRRQAQLMGSSESSVEEEDASVGLLGDQPRRRVHRGESNLLQEQPQQQLQAPQPVFQKNRRTAHNDEMNELNSFKNNENSVLKQLLGGY